MTKTNTLELPIFSNQASEASMAKIDANFSALKKRHEVKHRKFNLMKYLKITGAIAVASVAGYWYHQANETHVDNVTEIVKPHERVWNVVARAEHDAGVKEIDMWSTVNKVRARYGTDLNTGQKIVVPLERH